MNSCISAWFSDILLHSEERWGVRGGSGWRFGTSHPLMRIHGGFPRTWYSGNHCCGRASQLGSSCHILAMGIPEVHRHLISSDGRATPMHPYCPHSVASEWLDPRLMVSVFFEWFWVTFLLFVSGCWANSKRSRTVVVWLHSGVCVTICAYGVMACFVAFQHAKVTNGLWCHPSCIWWSPRHPVAFCFS